MRFCIALLFLLSATPSFAQDAIMGESAADAFAVKAGTEADGVRTYSGRTGQDVLVRVLRMKAKEGKDVNAQFDLCNFYAQVADYTESFKWCQIAADRGDAEAQLKMGDIYTQGQGIEANKAEAFNWYLFAAESGSEPAQLVVAAAYNNGDGVAQNNAEAWFWFSVTANANEPDTARQHRDELFAGLDPATQEKQRQRLEKWREKHPSK